MSSGAHLPTKLSSYWCSSFTIMPVLLATVEIVLLRKYATGALNFFWPLPFLAAAALLLGWKYKVASMAAFALLAIGAAAIFACAPLTACLAFAYSSFFAFVIALTQGGRLLAGLIMAVIVSVSATFFLDVFQTRIEYPNKKVIVFASMWARGEAKQAIVEDVIAEFEHKYPEYKVIVHWDGRWVLSKTRPRLLTGQDVPDLIEGGKDEVRILAQENYALPMDEYLNANSAFTAKPWRDDFLPSILSLCSYHLKPLENASPHPLEGKTCLIPGVVYRYFYFYNKSIARRLGISTLPQTWDEMVALCQKVRDAGVEPITLDSPYVTQFADNLLQTTIPQGELRKTIAGLPGFKPLTDPIYLRVFQLEREVCDKCLMTGWQSSQWPAAQQQFATGFGLFNYNGSWLPGELRSVMVSNKEIFDIGAMNVPRFPDEAPGSMVVDTAGWMVLRGGHEHKGAILLLQFFSDRLGKLVVEKDGNPVAFARAPLPVELSDVSDSITHLERAINDPVHSFAPNWKQNVYLQLHTDFCRGRPGETQYMTAEQFVAELERRTDAYRIEGGERAWE